MEKKQKKPNIYAKCDHIRRQQPNYVVDEELTKEIARNFRVLPSFEKTTYETIYKKYYSIERNEMLRCRWEEYKRHIEGRVFAPFLFPDTRDIHFYKGDVRLIQSESIRADGHGRRMRAGPGVDARGRLPIPQELHMRRGERDSISVKRPGERDTRHSVKRAGERDTQHSVKRAGERDTQHSVKRQQSVKRRGKTNPTLREETTVSKEAERETLKTQ